MTKRITQQPDDTPATVTQLAAALAALGHYEGTNSDTEHAREAARLGGESYYRLLLVNALLGHAEGEAVHADGTGVPADQVLAAHRQALAAVGALDDPAKLLGFLRWRTLRIAGPLRLFLQVKDFKPLSRAFLQLLSRTNAYRVAQTHEAYSEATAVCESKGLVEARRICRYAPFATPSGGNAGT